ncbi:MAG: dTMP kinase [Acidimicrobiales bacterium]
MTPAPGAPSGSPAPRGRFLVFEGGEATGKSTQAAVLAQRLGAVLTREPGGTDVGERIRRLLLHGPQLDARTETLLLLAARAEHVATVIAPSLDAGRDVVCDRFAGSTLTYQGWGRGLDPQKLQLLSSWAAAGCEPDMVVLLTVTPEVATARLRDRLGGRDRMEGEDAAFFARVAEGFASLAASDPARWTTVDGAGTVDQVAARVAAAVERALGAPALP